MCGLFKEQQREGKIGTKRVSKEQRMRAEKLAVGQL